MKPQTHKPKTPRKPSVILTEKQAKLAEGILDLKGPAKALRDAGYVHPKGAMSALKSKAVVAVITEKRAELSDAAQIKRADVIAGFQEAIELARASAEPATMIAGWREIGKMLGLYEPETKKIELTAGQAALRGKLEVMSDEELLQIASGVTIDGECTHE